MVWFFLQIAWLNIRLFNHITMTTAFPYADSLFGGWEKQIGIDWIYYPSIGHDSAFLRTIMAYSYTGLTSVSFILFIGVHIFIGRHRSFFFIEIFFFTAIIATGIGMFFPAMAAPAFYNISLTDYPNFEKIPGLYHLAHFDNLRKPTGEITLNPHILPGLVTFPSFHTAAGVLICFATFRSWLFAPTLLYSMTMIAATPVFGGHYFVDLLAGALIALVVSSWHVMSPRHRLAFSGPSRGPLDVQRSD